MQRTLSSIPVHDLRADSCVHTDKDNKRRHIEAIAEGLNFAREPLRYVTRQLRTAENNTAFEPNTYRTLRKEFMCALHFLISALDAIVLFDAAASEDKVSSNMNFFNTKLKDSRFHQIQEDIMALESFHADSNFKRATLVTVNAMLQRCMPSPWIGVKTFHTNNRTIQDFGVLFGEEEGGEQSGPLLHDLIIPAYNRACDLLLIVADTINMPLMVGRID